MWLGLAVFLTDGLISYCGWRRIDQWFSRKLSRVLFWTAAMDLAIGVNTMAFVIEHWAMLIPSITGSLLGTILAFRHGAIPRTDRTCGPTGTPSSPTR